MTDFNHTPIIELAALIANHLGKKDIKVVLVGGLAVEFYTKNIYLTKDIDMVDVSYQPPKVMHGAMAELGFLKEGKVYKNKSTNITVEFPSSPLQVGNDLIKETTTVSVANSELPILYVRDVVKDRLAAYFHWNDRPSLAQALTVMLCHDISPADVEAFCIREKDSEEFKFIEELHQMSEICNLKSMESIEDMVLKACLKRKLH